MAQPPVLSPSSLESLGVATETWGGAGQRWTLPKRDLGKLRYLGLLSVVSLLFAIPFLGTFLSFGRIAFDRAFNGKGAPPIEWISLIFVGVFALIFIFIAKKFWFVNAGLLGILTQSTYCVVTVDENEIRVDEMFGWGSWSRKLPDRSSIQTLAVVSSRDWTRIEAQAKGERSGGDVFNLPDRLNYGLVARLQEGKSFPIAIGYSANLLESLARAVGKELRLGESSILANRQVTEALSTTQRAVAIDVLTPGAVPQIIEYSKPDGTKVQIDRREDGITLTVPSQGLFKGSHGLFGFSILWLSFCTIFTVGVLWGAIHANQLDKGMFFVLFLLLFDGIGIAMLLGGIHMGTRSSVLATSYGSLFVSNVSVFGKKTQQWTGDNLESVEVAKSGMEVNDQPIMQVVIRSLDGKSFGCLTQLSRPELDWVAFELNRSLELNPIAGDSTSQASESS